MLSLCKYHLFFVIIDQYFPKEGWGMKKRKFEGLKGM